MGGLRYLTWLLSLLFIAVIVVFAVNNRHTVAIDVWPLPDSLNPTLRLFVIVLVPAALTFLLGWLVGWVNAGRHRARIRRQSERIERLTAEVRRLRARQDQLDESMSKEAETNRSKAASEAAHNAAQLDQPAHPALGGPAAAQQRQEAAIAAR
ncbi:MAG: DUF1049 domain-containing protein [Alphaproteobacteria bacterium]|nr:DUF1049 domain-containing protein [Alphaproteobacteria bacterium]